MKNLALLLTAFSSLALSSVSYANITGLDFWGGSGVVCSYTNYQVYGDWATANITEDQSGMSGLVDGTLTTDTPADPHLTIGNSVNNDTGGAWLGYQVNVSMSQTFTLSAISVSTPASWSLVFLSQPVLVGSVYQGTMAFSGPASVQVGGTFAFSYTMNFSSSTNYSFTQQMIPSFTAIPEPGPSAFAALGGLLLSGINLARRSNRRG